MTTSAISSHGTLIKIGDGATPEVFTSIAMVRDIGGIDISQEDEDVTDQDSGGWTEFIGTLLSLGEITFGLNFLPTNATHSYSSGLIEDAVNNTKRNFQIVFPDSGNTTWPFSALVKKVAIKAPVKGALRADVTLRPTGVPTLAG